MFKVFQKVAANQPWTEGRKEFDSANRAILWIVESRERFNLPQNGKNVAQGPCRVVDMDSGEVVATFAGV